MDSSHGAGTEDELVEPTKPGPLELVWNRIKMFASRTQ